MKRFRGWRTKRGIRIGEPVNVVAKNTAAAGQACSAVFAGNGMLGVDPLTIDVEELTPEPPKPKLGISPDLMKLIDDGLAKKPANVDMVVYCGELRYCTSKLTEDNVRTAAEVYFGAEAKSAWLKPIQIMDGTTTWVFVV